MAPASEVTVEVRWPFGKGLLPWLDVRAELPGSLDTLHVVPSLRACYAWLDAFIEADMDEQPLPPATDAMSNAQRQTLAHILCDWPKLEELLRSCYRAELRPHLLWNRVHVHREELRGWAWLEVSGHVTAPFSNEHEDVGIGALLLHDDVVKAGDRLLDEKLPDDGAPEVPMRPHPEHENFSVERVTALIEAEQWDELYDASKKTHDYEELEAGVLRWWWQLPVEEALERLPSVRTYLLRQSQRVGAELLEADPRLVRALIEVGRYHIPQRIVFEETDPTRVAGWKALGAEVDGPADEPPDASNTPLLAHLSDPAMLDALIEAGADPAVLFDANGALIADLDDHLRSMVAAALGPAVEEDLPPQQGALAIWLAHGWIELTDGAMPDEVDAALCAALERLTDPNAVVEAVLDVPGVDEVFIDDDTLEAFLAQW